AVGFHVQPPSTQASIQNLLRKEDERAKSAVYFYRKHPTVEVRLLIQATSVHRLLYSIQSGFGLLTPTNVEHIAARLRRSGRNGLADLVMRGVLNRHYVQRLDDELAQSRHGGQCRRKMSPAVPRLGEFIVESLHVVTIQHAAHHKICQPIASTAAQTRRNVFHVRGCQESESGLDRVKQSVHRRRLDEEPDFNGRMFSVEVHRALRSLVFFP